MLDQTGQVQSKPRTSPSCFLSYRRFLLLLLSWFCYRSQEQDFDYLKQLEDEERAKQSEQSFMVSDDWGCNANEWDDSDDMMNETSETNCKSTSMPLDVDRRDRRLIEFSVLCRLFVHG